MIDNEQLDKALARALGWRCVHDLDGGWRILTPDCRRSIGRDTEARSWAVDGPHFSRDWAGLGLLVDAMTTRGFGWAVEQDAHHAHVNFFDGPGGPEGWAYNHERPGADIPALAALAAARALGLAVEKE